MDRRVVLVAAVAVLAAVAVGVIATALLTPSYPDEVTVEVVGGDEPVVVRAAVADTTDERYTGLSDHESLADDEGMLFVHATERERTYVMRNMAFDIDIVFVDSSGEITAIHEARAPEPGEDGEELRYSGHGQYVLEVNRGTMAAAGVEPGDRILIDGERPGRSWLPWASAVPAGETGTFRFVGNR